ncbi:alkene reductase [Halodesulfovibrio sp. MK-HDV]|jgi:N-ethylmaleimide reductase|uniref:alkene reductase n=1 Tax=Halodesulfovibrio sp. MK-HDV TaxID=2599925 RepID=UPI001368C7D7|nr:alkene reductase [Halodesulfovibrio sp. MK-HDV]KAF1074859.1 N-ethylmaleimide reductase [Halodesulfovibrio sp. MK-HDV]
MKYNNLFEQITLGKLDLANRIVMAPMTRSRSTEPGNIPNQIMAEYYEQRSSVGLIISEATQVSLQGQGYARTPGIFTDAQVEGWKLVTDKIHAQGGKAFLQLWHVGRVGSSIVNGLQPVAPSACIAKDTQVYTFDGASNGDATFIPVEMPREMQQDDIAKVIEAFVQGALNAIKAGVDGVEIHAANGYLIDQFLRSNANKRTDNYGGSIENRVRLLEEITEAVSHEIGKDKVGVRLSPFIKFKDMDDPEILDTMMAAAKMLNKIDVVYLHLCEADWDDAPEIPEYFRKELRSAYKGTIIATGNKTPKEGANLINAGLVDLIGFGRKILANPDYPERIKQDAALNEIVNTHTLFGGGGTAGYTDYPFLDSK